MIARVAIACLCLWVSALASGDTAERKAVPVELRATESGWQLFRGGEPYLIKGVGGNTRLEEAAAAGANSIRLWGTDDAGRFLDEAHALGLTVSVGVWLGHERHGFDYTDRAQLDAQLEIVRNAVIAHRDHPAVLIWVLGNEMEGFAEGDNPLVWAHVNEAAALVKSLDPHHPTMTVTAEIGGERVRYVHEECDAIDIHGINSYGGAASLPERLRKAGATKPYVLTEFGGPGSWESPQTSWGAPLELNSSEKAAYYERAYNSAVVENAREALGSYVFLWGAKMEGSPTWFGMFLPTGERLATVDTMQRLWSGKAVDSPAPEIEPILLNTDTQLDPGDQLVASVVARGASPLEVEWTLLPESSEYTTGGDFRQTPAAMEGAVISASDAKATVEMPEYPGPYRLYATVRDEQGAAATANTPILVRGTPRTRFPVYVYREGLPGMPWTPSGWMGNTQAMELTGNDEQFPHDGQYSMRLRYNATFGWGAIAWQHPPNNWGDVDGGFDLTGATELELWARGEYGGERIDIGVGLLKDDVAFFDSTIVRTEDIVLTSEYKRYRVNLKGKDLSSLKTGFVVAIEGRRTPVTVYFDNIRFIR